MPTTRHRIYSMLINLIRLNKSIVDQKSDRKSEYAIANLNTPYRRYL